MRQEVTGQKNDRSSDSLRSQQGSAVSTEEGEEEMTTKCAGIIGAVFGHRYEARYNTQPKTPSMSGVNSVAGVVKIINAASDKDYVCDVCVRCGDIKK